MLQLDASAHACYRAHGSKHVFLFWVNCTWNYALNDAESSAQLTRKETNGYLGYVFINMHGLRRCTPTQHCAQAL